MRDGDEVFRSGFTDVATLDQALGSALQRYAPKEVRWSGDFVLGAGKPLLVVGFDDEKGEALKAFDDRTLVEVSTTDRIRPVLAEEGRGGGEEVGRDPGPRGVHLRRDPGESGEELAREADGEEECRRR